jgi:hypothetical protein
MHFLEAQSNFIYIRLYLPIGDVAWVVVNLALLILLLFAFFYTTRGSLNNHHHVSFWLPVYFRVWIYIYIYRERERDQICMTTLTLARIRVLIENNGCFCTVLVHVRDQSTDAAYYTSNLRTWTYAFQFIVSDLLLPRSSDVARRPVTRLYGFSSTQTVTLLEPWLF